MLKSFAAYGAIAVVAIAASVSMAQMEPEQPVYLDDRSTPEQLVLSYFNAINRGEFARAYSYFGPAEAPNFDAWQFQFDDVVEAEVSFGEMALEGAAGSIYYQFPVTVDYEHAEGQHHIERGCINIRWIHPDKQERPPFVPMYILSADLHTEAEEQGFAPAKCFSAPDKDTGSPQTLDDRSNPEQIIRSYYNAIDNGEYGRAVSYLGDSAKPADYTAWWQAFQSVDRTEVTLGRPSHYSNPGYISFSVPAVIKLFGQMSDWVDVGCIDVYQGLAGDEEPFTPTHITGVRLDRNPPGDYPMPVCD